MKAHIQTRQCKKCRETKALAEFPKHSSGHRWECKGCYRKRYQKWYGKNSAKVQKKSAERYAERPYSEWTQEEKDRSRKNQRASNERMRNQILDQYGAVCACCGESERRFLTFDHVNNDGAKHRRETHGSSNGQFYRWVIKNDYPDSIQVLCMNCNFGKSVNGGVCPHLEGATTIRKE